MDPSMSSPSFMLQIMTGNAWLRRINFDLVIVIGLVLGLLPVLPVDLLLRVLHPP
jgi:hypothetical protein